MANFISSSRKRCKMIPKYRAWDKTHKKLGLIDADMQEGYFQSVKIFDEDEDDWQESENFILMQSTGLADKNGVEIFEGDILKDDSESGKVVYDPDRTMWRVYGKDFDDALSDWWMGRVIGNIYENPELMEADDDTK